MKGTKLLGLVLLILGVLACVYGGFSYTKEDTKARIGPVELKMEEHKRVNVPLWAGLGAGVLGAALLLKGD
jgi:hypothetical protein